MYPPTPGSCTLPAPRPQFLGSSRQLFPFFTSTQILCISKTHSKGRLLFRFPSLCTAEACPPWAPSTLPVPRDVPAFSSVPSVFGYPHSLLLELVQHIFRTESS